MSNTDLWDTLSGEYDRFVNWEQRLAREMPFLHRLFSEHGARRVLDVACGTGHHAIALAERGYEVVGTDISAGMVGRARQNAESAGVTATFHQVGFGHLREAVKEPIDALLCLGNSLPSLLSQEALGAALVDMAQVLVPGGLIVIQDLNYDRIWPRRERFMPLVAHRQGEEEWLFLRVLDFHEQTLTFNMIIFRKQSQKWQYDVSSTELRPIFKDELDKRLLHAGFAAKQFYGDYAAHPYERDTSGDLIVVAQREDARKAA
jgi:glycine/sarcosine N-methyltransferase